MNDNFCSDIVALFFNHMWECPLCWFKVFAFIAVVFLLSGILLMLINIFTMKLKSK